MAYYIHFPSFSSKPQLVPDFPVVLQLRVTLRPKYGMRMRLQPAPEEEEPGEHITCLKGEEKRQSREK
jgi:hypothetical protein